jgi:tRNA A37 N6-isopentenylltransferase MiaA
MTIGTAVPSKSELETVKHHSRTNLFFENYTVGDFEKKQLQN